MRIGILVEGSTERAFKPFLVEFLRGRLAGRMPKLDFFPCDGRVYKGDKLRRAVVALLSHGQEPADAVIALTDVYTGSGDFTDAAEAKRKMRAWVGDEPRFHPHAAQHDFEAWLLPFWADIQRLAGHNRAAPAGSPETVNHAKPPAAHLSEIFRLGGRRSYAKPREAAAILRGKDLAVAAEQCPELKAFLNRILVLSGGEPL